MTTLEAHARYTADMLATVQGCCITPAAFDKAVASCMAHWGELVSGTPARWAYAASVTRGDFEMLCI